MGTRIPPEIVFPGVLAGRDDTGKPAGFVVMQPCGDAWQFGPFSALDAGSAGRLFDDAALAALPGTTLIADAPASNRSALRLYRRRNMRIAGSTELMYAGRKPSFHPELIYGLATLGSCG